MLYSKPITPAASARQRICQNYLADETQATNTLLSEIQFSESARESIARRAYELIEAIRKRQHQSFFSIEQLLSNFKLTSAEGRSLMGLAEALLRIPDKHTALLFLEDKLSGAEWNSSNSNYTNKVVAHFLWLAKTLLEFRHQRSEIKRFLSWCFRPVILFCFQVVTRSVAQRFILAETIEQAWQQSQKQLSKGYCFSYDMLGESARNNEEQKLYFQRYSDAITVIGQHETDSSTRPSISVKLSALHCRYSAQQHDYVVSALVPQLKKLALLAKQYDVDLTIDAEESDKLDLSLDIFEGVFSDKDLAGWQGFGLAVQAYQKRASTVIDWLIELAEKHSRKISVRLVKGAYWDAEIKWAQQKGLTNYPVFTTKEATDVSYLVCAKKLLNAGEYIYPQFATHNAYTVVSVLELMDGQTEFEFQRLHNMGQGLYDQLIEQHSSPCRIYAPVGKYSDLLAYLVRRMLENGANSSFVNNLADPELTSLSLINDPIVKLQKRDSKSSLALPVALYKKEFSAPARLNSTGIDLSEHVAVKQLMEKIAQSTKHLTVIPTSADAVVHNPADLQQIVGGLVYDTDKTIEKKINLVTLGSRSWSSLELSQRCRVVNNLADLIQIHQAFLISLLIKEAGKTVADSIDEVREAIDFCRYYSRQSAQLFSENDLSSRGVVLCISPWNFPLAIFTGQVVAALVTGNTVLAKVAEQTSLIAQAMMKLFAKAGISKHAVQLLLGPGLTIGEKVIPDQRIQAVMFTGSVKTAQWINKTLALRERNNIPFVAETGGQNAMIVDATAHIQQLVDDVLESAFHSAGQRCSALRVIYVDEGIADNFIRLLTGAMAELVIGDPEHVNTDIGPIIDQAAIDRLHKHCRFLNRQRADVAKHLFSCVIDPQTDKGHYFEPRLYEIKSIDLLEKEVFGPILHLIRFKADNINAVINEVNQSHYGLTLGLHSRIEQFTTQLASKLSAGNIYINRSMVGAVVGVQPFGGRSLSGTGPKAGGPHYLEVLVKHTTKQQQVAFTLSKQVAVSSEGEAVAEQAYQARPSWQALGLTSRITILNNFCTELFANNNKATTIVTTWLDTVENMGARLRAPIILPSPTGETNQLYYESRGVIVAIGHHTQPLLTWFGAVMSALTVGNNIICITPKSDKETVEWIQAAMKLSGMPDHVLQFLDKRHAEKVISSTRISAVLCPFHNHKIKQILASRSGAITPLLCADDIFYQQRLCLEKTISIDDTVAIGNASLLSRTST